MHPLKQISREHYAQYIAILITPVATDLKYIHIPSPCMNLAFYCESVNYILS